MKNGNVERDLDLNPTRVFLEMKMSINAQNERFQLGRLQFFINSLCQKQTLEFFLSNLSKSPWILIQLLLKDLD